MYVVFKTSKRKTHFTVGVSQKGITLILRSIRSCNKITLTKKPHLRSGYEKIKNLLPYSEFAGIFVLQFQDYLVEIRCFSNKTQRKWNKIFYIKIWKSYTKKFSYYELELVQQDAVTLLDFFKEYWSECELE